MFAASDFCKLLRINGLLRFLRMVKNLRHSQWPPGESKLNSNSVTKWTLTLLCSCRLAYFLRTGWWRWWRFSGTWSWCRPAWTRRPCRRRARRRLRSRPRQELGLANGSWKTKETGNTNWGGRLSTIYLPIKVSCFIKKVNNVFNIWRSCSKLVSTRR